MASSHIINYLDLDEENDELLYLQESLEQINQLSSKATKILQTFDQRLTRLDSLVKPIYQSSKSVGQLQQNVDGTIASVKDIVKYFDVVREEEGTITAGPNEDDLLPYLKSINNLQLANDFIRQVNMRSCERVTKQIKQLLETGLQNLNELFRKWLQQYSNPVDPTQYANRKFLVIPDPWPLTHWPCQASGLELNAAFTANYLHTYCDPFNPALDVPRPPAATVRLLEMLVTYLSTSESEIGTKIDYSKTFMEIRATYVAKSLALLFAAIDSIRVQASASVYQKGASPFITLTANLIKMSQVSQEGPGRRVLLTLGRAEHELINTVLPGDAAADVFVKIFQPLVKRYFESAESLTQIAKRSIQTEKFMLFDVFETLKYYQKDLDKALLLTPLERKTIANLIASMSTPLMTSFAEYMEEAKNMSKIPMPADGTIYEFTSSAINHMKRLLDHQETVESMMITLGDGHWGVVTDMGGVTKPRKTFSGQAILKHYFIDILHILTTSLENKVKGNKRSGLGVVFLMNNYHYIAKNIMGSKLIEILGENALRGYENLDWKYQDHFCHMWKSCVEYLADETNGPTGLKNKLVGHDKMTVKDKFKYFNSTLEELMRNQHSYTIPDQDLRLNLMDRVREIVIPAYTEFMERYQHTEFSKNSGKYLRYSHDSLDRTLQMAFTAKQ
ncbi:exocyst complex component exo70 [Tieghemiomyces parasiticus]|uniref:Exocyst complex protein EXO70 n=1 Tax=Tieghemiomyces parasiticus TaxID=78921 RepID=A0A9W8AKB3_9FUNG|nr:exocyst complex component exo70 [Tieghemiomyces parasiticus]